MKTQNIKYIIASLLFAFTLSLAAQETVNVPLSNPGKPGSLKVSLVSGSITVKGYSGDEVIVTATTRGRRSSNRRGSKSKEGLKRIAVNSLEFSAEEYDNAVIVRSRVSKTVDFEIQVPKNFSLNLRATNNGKIYVENVNGVMDISNTNGPITLVDISGSVSADALNRDIKVTFVEVTPDAPMAFSSLNGDIDITFPKDLKADIKVKSDRGEIFTDFELKEKPSKAKITQGTSERGNTYRVKVEKWIVGSINGGGPEILFKNFNGDVIIRSR
jgi:hypothetical protein